MPLMKRLCPFCAWAVVLWMTGWALAEAYSQDTAAPAARTPYRKLAPGVLESVDPARQLDESVSRHDIAELLTVDPELQMAKGVAFRHEVWSLDFKFKPVRLISVDVPQPSGLMQRKQVWYLVYSVTNTGKVMVPSEDAALPYKTAQDQKTWKVKYENKPVRFIPEFWLEGRDRMQDGQGFVKAYNDVVIPVAVGPIQTREDPSRRLLTTPEICREIKVGETLWGVATWQDIDPRIVRFSVYVQGLTNAYRWKDKPDAPKADDDPLAGRLLLRKTLKLNFWRPGDEYTTSEHEIRYGVPGGVDYEWVYR
jgi:hypothetical protein